MSREIALRILNQYYPDYRQCAVLPPDVLLIVMEYLQLERNTYYTNGDLKSRGVYVNNQLHGLHLSWYPRCKLRLKETYHYGKLHGMRLKFYPNGRLESSGSYHYGESVGKHVSWSLYGDTRFTEIDGEKYRVGDIHHQVIPVGSKRYVKSGG